MKYEPIQPITTNPGVTLIPINRVDLDILQRLQHGSTVIHYDFENNRSVLCHLCLDSSCGLMLWRKYSCISWLSGEKPGSRAHSLGQSSCSNSPLLTARSDGNTLSSTSMTTGGAQQVRGFFDDKNEKKEWLKAGLDAMSPSLIARFLSGDPAWKGLDEGYLKLSFVKVIETQTESNLLANLDVEALYKRHMTEEMTVEARCWLLVYGDGMCDNHTLCFVAPKLTAEAWTGGLEQLVGQFRRQGATADRRNVWLKKMYLDLYYDNDICRGPRPANAIAVSNWLLYGLSSAVV